MNRWKRLLPMLLWMMIAFVWETSAQQEAGEPAAKATFHAIVCSDLHYTSSKTAVDTIVSGIAFADEIADALMEEVIAEAPDVLIMTGDNTNSGSREDALLLAEKLRKVRDAGIAVVVTTGNHDMRVNDPTVFEDCYFDLFEPEERDPASSSYVQVVSGVALFAMDDNAVEMGGAGRFSANTVDWLERMLMQYTPQYPVVFLSHHNVLVGRGQEHTESFQIQNDGLAELLKRYGVRLIMTGHLHSQMLEEWEGLYEVVNAMPYGGEHTIGELEMLVQDCAEGSTEGSTEEKVQVHYAIRPLHLAEYGREGLAEELEEKDLERRARFRGWFREILENAGCPERSQEAASDLMEAFFRYYEEGTLADHRKEIRFNPVYQIMIDALWDKNYGPWMDAALKGSIRNASTLDFCY